MTREEIIDGLQYTIDMFCFNPSTGEVTDKNRLNDESRLTVDACEGAIEIIKALEQQPCGNAIDRAEAIKVASGYCHPANVAKELAKLPPVNLQPCEDAISRQAVFEMQAKYAEYMGATKFWQMSDDIKALPPVTPQPKTGHWITKIKSDLRGDMWSTNPKCSECGGEPYYSNTIYNYKFCPYCGAKMVEPQESEIKG